MTETVNGAPGSRLEAPAVVGAGRGEGLSRNLPASETVTPNAPLLAEPAPTHDPLASGNGTKARHGMRAGPREHRHNGSGALTPWSPEERAAWHALLRTDDVVLARGGTKKRHFIRLTGRPHMRDPGIKWLGASLCGSEPCTYWQPTPHDPHSTLHRSNLLCGRCRVVLARDRLAHLIPRRPTVTP